MAFAFSSLYAFTGAEFVVESASVSVEIIVVPCMAFRPLKQNFLLSHFNDDRPQGKEHDKYEYPVLPECISA
jgi:hypothetical protein